MAERHSSRCCAHLRSPYGQRRELQDRVPVPTRSARAKLLVDDGVGQAGAADTVRVDDVEMFARSGDHFAALDGLLQRLNARSAGRMLEKHHDQMARIARGFLAEWIVRDDALPFLRGADEEICSKTEALLGLCFQQKLELGSRSPRSAKNEIPALEQRPYVGEAELGEEIA